MVGMARIGQRRPPERHDTVAHVFINCAAMAVDHARKRRQKFVHQQRQILGFQPFRDRGKAAHIGEENGHFAAFAFHRDLLRILAHLVHDFARHILAEQAGDLAFGAFRREVAIGHVQREQRKDHDQSARQGQGHVAVLPQSSR